MKAMVALEVGVLRLLAGRARAAGLDPAIDPVPGLRRDVLFACTADEEAGGWNGAGWLVDHRPETIRAAGALNEAGGMPIEVGGRRFYADQVAEKGYEVYRIRVRGTWGHGSMPRDDNALVLAAEVVTPHRGPGRAPPDPGRAPAARGGRRPPSPPDQAALVAAIVDDDPRRSRGRAPRRVRPRYALALNALLRDTFSPTIMHAGIKYNVIPGEAMIEVDCRTLPGTTEGDVREELLARIGDLAPQLRRSEHVIGAVPVEAPAEGALYEAMAAAIRAHDPDGIPVPVMAPFATDAKHTVAPRRPDLRVLAPRASAPGERFLDRFHGSTSGSASTRSAGACPSCTTSSPPTAAERPARSASAGARRVAALRARASSVTVSSHDCAAEDPAQAPGPLRVVGGRVVVRGRSSTISAQLPSSWRCSIRYCNSIDAQLVHRALLVACDALCAIVARRADRACGRSWLSRRRARGGPRRLIAWVASAATPIAISARSPRGMRPHRRQELLRAGPVDHPQHGLAALREPDRPQPPVVVLAPPLDEAPLDEPVDQPRRRRRRAADGVREVGDRGRRPLREDVQRGQLREPEVELAQLRREPDDQLPPQRAAHRDALRDLADVLDPRPGRDDGRRQVRLEHPRDDPARGAPRRRARRAPRAASGPAAGSEPDAPPARAAVRGRRRGSARGLFGRRSRVGSSPGRA